MGGCFVPLLIVFYPHDDVGNRLTRNTNGTVETYTYFAGTNSLQAVTGGQNPRTFSYDPNGNIIGDGTLTFIYDQNNQLAEVEQGANSLAEYAYNGLGQRVIKQAGANTTVYHYDLNGQLIAESLLDGTMTREYLYMGKVRMAMVDVAGGNALYHYLNDRLGTPEILTDASGTVAWEAWYEPFGEAHIHPSSSVVNNLRLPGQYYDSETGFHYNYYRYYDPTFGRYLTPDPIGLSGGINFFTYIKNNPIGFIDPFGLRHLTPSEKEALRFYFGSSLNVEIIDLGTSIYGAAWSPYENRISLPDWFFKSSNECEELNLSDPYIYSVFAHEALHVRQRQHGKWVSVKALFPLIGARIGIYNPYEYIKSTADPQKMLKQFQSGTVEQQGQILQDFVYQHQKFGYAPVFIEVWAYLLTT